jgi:hypothetical protein
MRWNFSCRSYSLKNTQNTQKLDGRKGNAGWWRLGRWGKTHPRAWETKPLVESPVHARRSQAVSLGGWVTVQSPTERFTHTRCALAPTVPRHGNGGKAPASKGNPNVLAIALRPSRPPQLIRASAVQGSPGSGLCAAMPTPEGKHGMICTAPSPRRRLFLPPNLGLGPG